MRSEVEIYTQPEGLPITLPSAKEFLRVTGNSEDQLITDLIGQAANMAELYLKRSLITRTMKLTLDGLPLKNPNQWWNGVKQGAISDLYESANFIDLPYSPIISITSITYYDTSDTSATFDSSNYFLDSAGAKVCLTNSGIWPTSLRPYKSMEILYKAGYGESPENLPFGLQSAIRLLVSFLYQNRDCAEMPEGVLAALNYYRNIRL